MVQERRWVLGCKGQEVRATACPALPHLRRRRLLLLFLAAAAAAALPPPLLLLPPAAARLPPARRRPLLPGPPRLGPPLLPPHRPSPIRHPRHPHLPPRRPAQHAEQTEEAGGEVGAGRRAHSLPQRRGKICLHHHQQPAQRMRRDKGLAEGSSCKPGARQLCSFACSHAHSHALRALTSSPLAHSSSSSSPSSSPPSRASSPGAGAKRACTGGAAAARGGAQPTPLGAPTRGRAAG